MQLLDDLQATTCCVSSGCLAKIRVIDPNPDGKESQFPSAQFDPGWSTSLVISIEATCLRGALASWYGMSYSYM